MKRGGSFVFFIFLASFVFAVENGQLSDIIARAEKGDAEAQYELGEMYEKGQGIEQNYAKALEWYRKAAEQGVKAQEFRDMKLEALAQHRAFQKELLRMREHKARIDKERQMEIEIREEGVDDKIELSLIRFETFLEDAENKARQGEFQEAINSFNAAMALKSDNLWS